MIRALAIAQTEIRIVRRNHWVLMATLIMVLFSLALTFAGSAPSGGLGVDMLTVSVASMTTLSVYLAPLLALMISFDAIAGEADRGGLALLLSYPVTRGDILLGKFLAHTGTLAFATFVGFGSAGAIAVWLGGADSDSLLALLRLILTSILLGSAFLALGYTLSSLAGSTASAAGLAAVVWLVFVVLYDLGLLGAVVLDSDGRFTQEIFPWLLALNPADAFRLWNVSAAQDVALVTGMTGAADSLSPWVAPVSLFVWPLVALLAARIGFARVEP
ncbi:MAG: ABC transporter permease [Rhodobacteraceae bacterium]|nr:ABC transporter permease [Paracoccaceae bacterium]